MKCFAFQISAICLLAVLQAGICHGAEREATSRKAIDFLTTGGRQWEITTAKLEKDFAGAFAWIDDGKTEADFDGVKPRLSWRLLDVGATRVVFEKAKLVAVEVSIYDRSEGPALTRATYEAMVQRFSKALDALTGFGAKKRSRNQSAVKADGLVWATRDTCYVLEFAATSSEKKFQAEYIKLKVFPPGREPAWELENSSIALGANVKREGGRSWIVGVPMIDQGEKGYCAVASLARILRYYGGVGDMHEMAKLLGSKVTTGTSMEQLLQGLREISAKLKLRKRILLDVDERAFTSIVRRYNREAATAGKKELPVQYVANNAPSVYFYHMDPGVLRKARSADAGYAEFKEDIRRNTERGVPLIWALMVGIYPEKNLKADYKQAGGAPELVSSSQSASDVTGEKTSTAAPSSASQRRSAITGHVRIIIGHDVEMKNVLYTDSWGRGHELKSMSMEDAYAASMGLILVEPTR